MEEEDKGLIYLLAVINEFEMSLGKVLSLDQKKHLTTMLQDFIEMAVDKYIKGVIEHGGNLQDKNDGWLKSAAKEEVVDMWHYISTIRGN